MTFRVVPRTTIGLPMVVTSSNGVPRPRIHNCRWYTFHYTGVSSRGYKTSDVAHEVRRIQEVFSKTKPFEYNYVIGQNEDDLIYEFAGKFMAAHSAGENTDAVGVLFLNATHEPLTPTQIRKAQWLRDTLKFEGTLTANVDQRPHQWMPGAATACPGPLIMSDLTELVQPYRDPELESPYDPENGKWGLFPHLPKRNLHQGDVGPDVVYLHDALRIESGYDVCGDVYTQRTTDAVCNLQAAFRAQTEPEAGYVGPKTWGIIDWTAIQ